MSGKIVQLDMFEELKNDTFEEVTVKSFKALFARDSARQKDLKTLAQRNMDLEEVVFRMNTRINNLTENMQGHD